MADKGIQKVSPGGLAAAPSHIKRGANKEGSERLAQFIRPPYVKIVQKQSDDALLAAFSKGTTILSPANVVVAPPGGSFYIVPLIQYPEYSVRAPIDMKGQVPYILDRTTDANHAIAVKARNKETWTEKNYKFEDKVIKEVRNVESIVFIVMIMGDFGMIPCIMTFERSEFKTGRTFATLLQMRNADAFGCVFKATVSDTPRSNEKGSWYGWDISNPGEGDAYPQWVEDPELFETFRKMALEMEKNYQNDLIRVDYDADAEGAVTETREDL